MKKLLIVSCCLFCVFMFSTPSYSLVQVGNIVYNNSWTVKFGNDYAPINSIYLWTIDGQTDKFTGASSFNPNNWGVFKNTGYELFMFGITVNNGYQITGSAGVTINVSAQGDFGNFGFEWAEVLWNEDYTNYEIKGSGTFLNGSNVGGFTHTNDIANPIPEPTTLALLGLGFLGIGGFGYIRRKKFNTIK